MIASGVFQKKRFAASFAIVSGFLAIAPAGAQTRIDTALQARDLPAGSNGPSNQRCADPFVERVSDVELRVGKNWTSLSPCSFRWGTLVKSFSRPFSIRIDSASALTVQLRVQMSLGGVQVVVNGATDELAAVQAVKLIDAAGLVIGPGSQGARSSGVIPLFSWNLTGGKLDAQGKMLLADSFQMDFVASGGAQFVVTETGAASQVPDRGSLLRRAFEVPTQSGPCLMTEGGLWAADAQYLYLCVPDGVGGNRWSRTPVELNW